MEIIDCTIRDGGYVNDWKFSKKQVSELYDSLNSAGVDYMEIGFRREKNESDISKFGEWYFCDESLLNETIIEKKKCKIAVMAQLDTFEIDNFIHKKDSKIDMIRILMAYHGFNKKTDDQIDVKLLDKGIEQMKELRKMGYELSFNIGRIDKLSDEQLDFICKKISEVDLKNFYMADTYGSLDLFSTKKYVELFKYLLEEKYKTNIKIGFHAHNNFQNATPKTLYALQCGASSIDGTVLGFGRGSGNASTELLLIDLNKNFGKNYNFREILKYADKNIKGYQDDNSDCSYNLLYVLAATYGFHVNYAIEFIEKLPKMDMANILKIFDEILKRKMNMFYYGDLIKSIINEKNISNNLSV